MSEVPQRDPSDALLLSIEGSRHVIEASIRVSFGAAALTIEVTRRVLAEAIGAQQLSPNPDSTVDTALDAVLGMAFAGAQTGLRAADATARFTAPVTSTALNLVLEPPLVPKQLRLGTQLNAFSRRWRAQRTDLVRSALRSGSLASPILVETTARVLNINQLITSVIDQIDMDALALELLDRIKVDPLMEQAVAKVDIVEAVGRVMEVLPADQLVAEVLSHLDMEALIATALEKVDLTDIVVERVDLATIVNAALDRIDITSIVLNRVDLPLIANTVIDEIDLTGTIHEYSGSVATEMVHGARISSVDADRAIARMVDRFTFRRKNRNLDAPGDPESLVAQENVDGLEP